jgi:hypothetical protein
MKSSIPFWTLVAATLCVYAAMIFWSIPSITREADGLAIFDMRPGGYTFDEAKAFLAALSDDGRRFYGDVQQRLDIAYPALLAITLGWSILRLAPHSWGLFRYILAATAIPGMMFDYWENADVAAMLAAGPDEITPETVAAASLHSQIKAGASTVAMTILLALLVWWAFRRWRAKRA